MFPGVERASLLRKNVNDVMKKCFITLRPGVNVIKLFSFIADDEAK
jgi:hypothetical protein